MGVSPFYYLYHSHILQFNIKDYLIYILIIVESNS